MGGRDVLEVEETHTVVFPVAGLYTIQVENDKVTAAPAKVVYMSPDQIRRVDHPFGGQDKSVFVTLGPSYVEPYVDGSGGFPVLTSAGNSRIDYQVGLLEYAARRGHLTALDLSEFIVSALHSGVDNSEVGEVKANQRSLVADAEEYLSLHFQDDRGLTEMAKEIGASPHHLSRVFKRITGESLTRRRMRLRLVSALHQIRGGAEDLSTVALECGFYDHSHLTNSFRRHFGVTPKTVRISAM